MRRCYQAFTNTTHRPVRIDWFEAEDRSVRQTFNEISTRASRRSHKMLKTAKNGSMAKSTIRISASSTSS